MVEKIYNDILELLKSDELRNDLLENYTNLNIKDYEDIITHAPVKLGKKIELLEQLREVTKNNQEKDGITVVIENGRKAIRRLYKFDKSKSVLLLKQINGEKKAGLTVHKVQDNFPVVSYSSALDYIAKRVNEQVKSYARPRGIEFMPYWYWEIELYDMKEGHSERIYKYICSYLGDVLYYICYIDSTDSAFRGGNLNLPVPYRPGDILKVDCHPFNSTAYCFITTVGNSMDLCSVQCLYLKRCGIVGHGSLKQRECAEYEDFQKQYISPLFCAELVVKELPDKYTFMKIISEKLKKDFLFRKELLQFFLANERIYIMKSQLILEDSLQDMEECGIDYIEGISIRELLKWCGKR